MEVHTAIYQMGAALWVYLMAPGPLLASSGQSLRILADEILGLGLGGMYPSSKNRRPQFLTRSPTRTANKPTNLIARPPPPRRSGHGSTTGASRF